VAVGLALLLLAAPVVSPAKSRRVAAQWGGALTFLPTWAPKGVAISHWWSETCACAMDDSRLVVRFRHRGTRLDWVVSDPQEVHRRSAGIVCRSRRFAARFVDDRAVFYRRRGHSEIAWICIPSSTRWAPGFDPAGGLTISVRQVPGRRGALQPSELERMVASARPSPPGRTSGSRYELPAGREVERMAAAFRRPLVLPTRLPGGFIYSDWNVAVRAEPGFDDRRRLSVVFGRDSLFAKIDWAVSSGVDTSGLDCPRKNKPARVAVIHGRAIYDNEGIHGVSVRTCLPPHRVGNTRPLEISLWYDIRLHSRAMLRLAMRMVGTAQPRLRQRSAERRRASATTRRPSGVEKTRWRTEAPTRRAGGR
jgi:hypothetical protein